MASTKRTIFELPEAAEMPREEIDREGGGAHPETAAPGKDLALTYFNHIRNTPRLTREEEHELAVRYARTGDRAAEEKLLASQLKLVVKIAHEYALRDKALLLDLVQEGNLGLVTALRKFDASRDVRLSTYAAWWVRAYILRFILGHSRLVRLGTTAAQRKLFFGLRKEKEQLAAKGIDPTAAAIATSLDVPEADVIEMDQRMARNDVSLDAPLSDDSERSHLDLLESSDDDRPDSTVEKREFRARMHQRIEAFGETLEGREQDIFRHRLLAEDPETLQVIGERHGISRERARQLELGLVARLRAYLANENGTALAA